MAYRPFDAYIGDEPYLFVSYGHDDAPLVFPELDRLRGMGFNVWYDAGIRAGRNWSEELAQRIENAAVVIYMITPRSVVSKYCVNEVHYALDIGRPVLAVHLRDAVLPSGLRMQLGATQAILRHRLSEPTYAATLKEAIVACLSGRDPSQPMVRDAASRTLPTGTVTLLSSRIDGVAALLEALGKTYADVVARQRELLREAIAANEGVEVELYGDDCLAAFRQPRQAIAAAIEAQTAVAAEPWPAGVNVGVCMAVHSGHPDLVDDRYYGLDVHRAERIRTAGHGGQILLSSATAGLLGQRDLPAGVVLRDLGSHRLKDMPVPEILFDLLLPGLPSQFQPIVSMTNRPNNLPTELTEFVGREKELEEICNLLRSRGTRVVTLTGPGGTGKTRLSIEAAGRLVDDFPDGVFQVRLASISDAGLIATTIIQTLGVPEFASQSPLHILANRLAHRQILLVLDNFEQLMDGAPLLAELLDRCSHLKLLITSREALAIRAEREYAVAPLRLPARNRGVAQEPLERVEAVRLFVDRVRDFDPDFRLTEANRDAVAQICSRLDGLPLALELAAPRLRLLSPQALLNDLGQHKDLLRREGRDLPDRQRTLRNAIAWSYQLLDEDERELFRKVSVFVGGFTVGAVQEICATGSTKVDVLDRLTSLMKKSLLIRDADLIEPRLRMLETIRDFGFAELGASADRDSVRAAHAEYFLFLAESTAPHLIRRDQRAGVTRLLIEADNIRAAVAWSIEQGDARATSRFFDALLWLWIPRGQFAEAKATVRSALEALRDGGATRERAMMLDVFGWLHLLSGDYASALPLFEQSLAIFESLGDPVDVARSKSLLGVTRVVVHNDVLGARLVGEGLAMSRELRDPQSIARALLTDGIRAQVAGDFGMAESRYTEALALYRELGNMYWPGQLLQNLAHFRLHEGDWKRAAELFAEALQIGRELDYPMIINLSVAGLGGVAVARGMYVEAARLFGAVRASLAQLGVTLEPPDQAEMDGYVETARAHLPAGEFDLALAVGAGWQEQEVITAAKSLRGSSSTTT